MKRLLKGIRDGGLSAVAAWQGFSFPAYYPWWRIKRDMLFGWYEAEVTAFFKKRVTRGMVVLDIGANIGYFTCILARLVGPEGRVYAFEPDAENFEVLQKNISRYPWVRAFPYAVTDRPGKSDFYHIRGSVGTHSILPADNAEKRSVQAVSIDEFLLREGVSRINVAKVDVEGAESLVFVGMQQTLLQKPAVVFEYTPDTSEELLRDLSRTHNIFALTARGELQPLDKMHMRFGKRAYANVVLGDAL